MSESVLVMEILALYSGVKASVKLYMKHRFLVIILADFAECI